MTGQAFGLFHYHLRKRIHQKGEEFPSPDKLKRFYDKFIYVIAILAPIANIPQLLKIWVDKTAAGVSAISWFIFSFFAVTWVIYGFIHKDKHLIIMYSGLIITQVLIAIGAVIYG